MSSRPVHMAPLRLPEQFWESLTFAMPAPLEPTYAEVVIGDAPILYWPLGEVATNTAVDLSGNGRHGRYMAAPDVTGRALTPSAPTPFALDVNATSAWVLGPIVAPSSRMTYECWVMVRGGQPPGASATQDGGLISNNWPGFPPDGLSQLGTDLYRQGGNVGGTLPGPFSGFAPPAAHLMWAVDSGVGRLYLNNSLRASVALSNETGSGAIIVGATGSGGEDIAPVAIAHCAVYTGALSAERAAAHYTAGTVEPQRGVLGTTNLRYLGPPQQWVFDAEASPRGDQDFTLIFTSSMALPPVGATFQLFNTRGTPTRSGLGIACLSGSLTYAESDPFGNASNASRGWVQSSGRAVWAFVHRVSTVVATTTIYRNGVFDAHIAAKVWTEQRSILIGASVFTASSGTLENLYILNRALDDWEVRLATTALMTAP